VKGDRLGGMPDEALHTGPRVASAPAGQPLCPLCGGPNACMPAACGHFDVPCWCREASFAPVLLARIPPAQRGLACICAACAEAACAVPQSAVP
jgi:Cysteine-rich CWC